ncbi:hypothetical protein [Mycobacterium attenuatum]|uniref:hypothetical protein n=1 Tax=Mycobacterium attenuatum TaxID=2341086 RepID=UPI000F03C102|nr:hypothetical protein [Mycobacterium attenuatum]VBA56136.1 hypothetical protein LAUMK191_03557 [Mycobacterium attenuatum]VBA59785.1 hypothetical protein LAUMK41_03676 [Mycobacterium attenuatum]
MTVLSIPRRALPAAAARRRKACSLEFAGIAAQRPSPHRPGSRSAQPHLDTRPLNAPIAVPVLTFEFDVRPRAGGYWLRTASDAPVAVKPQKSADCLVGQDIATQPLTPVSVTTPAHVTIEFDINWQAAEARADIAGDRQ